MSNDATQYKYHPKNPANQMFIGDGRRNLTKKSAWWQRGNSNTAKGGK